MNKKTKKLISIIGVAIIIIIMIPLGIIASLFTPSTFKPAKPLKIAWSKYLLANKENYLTCEELPDYEYAQKVLDEHKETVKELGYYDRLLSQFGGSIDNIVYVESAAYIGADQFNCPGKGQILFNVDSIYESNEIIDKYGETFFGIPYRIINT